MNDEVHVKQEMSTPTHRPRRSVRVTTRTKIVAIVIAVAAIIAVPSGAYAYVLTGMHWYSGTLTIDYSHTYGNFTTGMQQSTANYNASTHVHLTNANSPGCCSWTAEDSNHGANGYEGSATWSGLPGRTTACSMYLNTYYLTGSEPLTRLKVVWEHETGHCLGLDHVSGINHVMYHSASDAYLSGGVTGLTSDEIAGINYMY